LREHAGYLLHRSDPHSLLLTGARSRDLLQGLLQSGSTADVLHFGRSEHFLLPGKPNSEPPHCSLSESDYEPTAVVISRQRRWRCGKKFWVNRQRYICFPAHILLKEDLTSAECWMCVMVSLGGLASTNSLLKSVLLFSFTPARDTTRLHLKGRFYG
jgi:hypothetical protein